MEGWREGGMDGSQYVMYYFNYFQIQKVIRNISPY